MTARVEQANLEAEESVLGAMLLSPRAIEAASDELTAAEFYRPAHGAIFDAIVGLHARGEPVDPITLTDFLEESGELSRAGGKQRVHELVALAPAASNVSHHARIVREAATLRALGRAGQTIAQLARDRPGDTDELVARAETLLSDVTARTAAGEGFSRFGEGLDELFAEIEEAYRTGAPRMGLATGFTDLDRALLGLHPGQLVIVAARPSMGKSALVQNIAENVVDHHGKVGFYSLEMSKAELQVRALSRAAEVDSSRLRDGQVLPAEFEKLQKAIPRVKARDHGLFTDDKTTLTPVHLRTNATRLQRKHGLDLLVVDYLQLMVAGGKTEENRTAQMSSITRALKVLARDLAVPVVALSQLNRQLESREDKRPRLSDLRDSGSIEQDADVVLFVYRDDYYNTLSEEAGIAEIIVAKQRMGDRPTVKLAFVKRYTAFKNLARTEEQ